MSREKPLLGQVAEYRAKRLHYRGPDRQIGHEMVVHDVDVDPVGAGLIDRMHFIAEPGEVRGEDRGGDDRHRFD